MLISLLITILTIHDPLFPALRRIEENQHTEPISGAAYLGEAEPNAPQSGVQQKTADGAMDRQHAGADQPVPGGWK